MLRIWSNYFVRGSGFLKFGSGSYLDMLLKVDKKKYILLLHFLTTCTTFLCEKDPDPNPGYLKRPDPQHCCTPKQCCQVAESTAIFHEYYGKESLLAINRKWWSF